MKILRPNISFEFFPPKTMDGSIQLSQTATWLAQYHPNFFSVTFGAGGSTRDGTIETVKMLQQQVTMPVAPHLACIGVSKNAILEILQTYKQMGVRRVVALRGDLPSGEVAPGELEYAVELVSLIRETMGNAFHIEVAAYPEVHPQAKNATEDVLNLKNKQDAGADSAITQYFFNPDAYFYFLDRCAKFDISIPIIPGIMPITQYNRLARFSQSCGAEIPRYLCKRLEEFGDDLVSLQAFGAEFVYNLCDKLIAGGAPGLHFYTLNKAEAILELLALLGISDSRKKQIA